MYLYSIDVVFEIPIVDVICVDCGPLTDFLMHVYMDYGIKGGIYIHEKKLSSCIFIAQSKLLYFLCNVMLHAFPCHSDLVNFFSLRYT